MHYIAYHLRKEGSREKGPGIEVQSYPETITSSYQPPDERRLPERGTAREVWTFCLFKVENKSNTKACRAKV